MKRAGTTKQKRIIIVAGVVLVAVLGLGWLIAAQLFHKDKDPYKQPETINTKPDTSADTKADAPETPLEDTPDASAPDANANTDTSQSAPLDPATVSVIEVPALGLAISYVKGVGGFEYEVKRTDDGTRYVQLSSPELIGTKCTNDNGSIAAIIEYPTATDTRSVTKTVTVGDTNYGFAPGGATCTANPDLLKRYQASFGDAFSLLKKSATQ